SVPLPPTACLATTVFSGLLIMTPIAVVADMPTASTLSKPEVLGGILYVGLGASVVAFCAWQAGVARIGAARAGVYLHLVPVFTLIFGVLLLDETLTYAKTGGVLMVLVGLLVSRSRHTDF
ncbi:DMT family transporter, partial [Marivita geojedonensis]